MQTKWVKIEDVKVGERVREDVGDLNALAMSIKKHGLMHPIVVTDDLRLIAGYRRLQACKMLGWDGIAATVISEVDELGLREMELVENVQRKDLGWPEKVKSVRELHRLMQERYGASGRGYTGGFGVQELAALLGVSVGTVSQDLQLAALIERVPELAKVEKKTTALRKVKKIMDVAMREKRVAEQPPQAEGVELFVVVESTPRRIQEYSKKEGIDFHLISDREKRIYQLYQVSRGSFGDFFFPSVLSASLRATFKGYFHGKFEGDEFQRPACFIVAPSGKLVYAKYGKNIADVINEEEFFKALAQLKKE